MTSSILQSEIFKQSEVVKELIDTEDINISRIVKDIKNRFKYIVIAARGSSDNAARYAQYLFGVHNNLQVSLSTPSVITLYHSSPDFSEALVIGISQSGRSPDIVSVLAEGKRQGRPTIAVTNDISSPLAQIADYIIPLHANFEKAIAATKTYTSSLAAMALFSCHLDGDQHALDDLKRIPKIITELITNLEPSINNVQRYRYMEKCTVIGRGYNYATAFEIALKIKELTRVVAEPYSSADFMHGPIATIQPGFPVILISPTGAVFQDMAGLIAQLNKMEAELLIISDDSEMLKNAHLPFPIPTGLPEWLTPLVYVIPGQLFSMKLAIEKGLDPDHPGGLQKVTETL